MPLDLLTALPRARIRRWVLSAFPRDPAAAVDYDRPLGDPGLFGPDSVTWLVHASFPGMLAGGLCSLMLQTLHPRALAGVWDHSNFRDDMVGRLRRTTRFVGGTTYAPRADAEAMITRVRAIHADVRGVTADGVPYAADEPELLTWVHVTEAYSFLQGFQRYARVNLRADEIDRYYDEVRRIAEALGAVRVPASAAAVGEYFQRVRPELRFDERSRIVLGLLRGIRLPVPAAVVSRELFLNAGSALLPGWAAAMLGETPLQHVRAQAAARLLRTLSPLFDRALADGIATRSWRRVGCTPPHL
ncbi:MAG: oxygenase MpaB family protein [Gammaproteobacteria bacterium]|jgi:uncharacterized protein (DUF2236 family)